MINLSTISRIYFLGIGGIGMSALARYFLKAGVTVSGYDRAATSLSRQLEKEGALVHYEDEVAKVDGSADLVVYTPAIPGDMGEFVWYRENGYQLAKRSDVLAAITESTYNICVAGTHGKTTISAMIAHLLRATGYGCAAFLGGIAKNYLTNFWDEKNGVCVVEADEYDRSFLKLSPNVAVISAMDADHLDIYGSRETMQEAFVEFGQKTDANGLLLLRFGLPIHEFSGVNTASYSLQNENAAAFAKNVMMKDGGYAFDHVFEGELLEDLRLNMGGMHNVENMVAAIAVARYLDIDANAIREAVQQFSGVKRRFEYVIDAHRAGTERHNVVFIDDYAHHPVELKALIQGAKALFSKRKCTIVFQPHLYSRTADFAGEFAEALDLAGEILLLPIYPARELPMEGVDSELILRKMQNKNGSVVSKEGLLQYLATDYLEKVDQSPYGQLFITAGAGNIDQLVGPIKEIFVR